MTEATGGIANLVPPDDPYALAQAILQTLERPSIRPPTAWPSFQEAAAAHLHIFELALTHSGRDRHARS